MEELYVFETERLMSKISKFFEIKNKTATEKAISMSFKLSHEKLSDINENRDLIIESSVLPEIEAEIEADSYTEVEEHHLTISLIEISYFIYSFTFQEDEFNEKLLNNFSMMFVEEIMEITNNVNQI